MFEKRDARVKLAKLLDIVEAYYNRLSFFFDYNFKFEEIPKPENLRDANHLWLTASSLTYFSDSRFLRKSPSTHIIVVSTKNLKEFIKLKTEFENEYKVANSYGEVLTHSLLPYSETAIYDNNLRYDLNLIVLKYSNLIDSINKFKIYETNEN